MEHHEHLMGCSSLCCTPSGEKARVFCFMGDPQCAARLRDLGVVEGAEVSVLRNGDPLLVRVGDARFGIGRSAAMNVLCHATDEEPPAALPQDAVSPARLVVPPAVTLLAGPESASASVNVVPSLAMKTTLDMLQPGDDATVLEVEGDDDAIGRLMEMGLLPGTAIKLVRYAPLGDPLEIVARGYHLTLRRAEAAGIVVETAS